MTCITTLNKLNFTVGQTTIVVSIVLLVLFAINSLDSSNISHDSKIQFVYANMSNETTLTTFYNPDYGIHNSFSNYLDDVFNFQSNTFSEILESQHIYYFYDTTLVPHRNVNDLKIIQDKTIDVHSITIPFVENLGQTDPVVKYYADTFAGTIFVTDDSITYSTASSNVITEHLVGSYQSHASGVDKSDTNVSLFLGNDESKWKPHVSTYNAITFGKVWNGITLNLSAHGNNVEKIFIISPHSDVSQIRLGFDGVDSISLDQSKRLLLHAKEGPLIFASPIAYQYIDGKKIIIPVQYKLFGLEYGFSMGQYDKNYDLVIDPIIQSTYLGGTVLDIGRTIAIDSSGNVYVAGESVSTAYPGISGGAQATHGGTTDIIISKLNSGLTTLTQSTYLGGADIERAQAIAIDSSGNVYVAGETASGTYPGVSGGAQSTHGGTGFADFRE